MNDKTKQEQADDAFGDAVYQAWRAGLNSDLVDRERVRDDVLYNGMDRFDAADAEVVRLRNYERRQQPEECDE